MSCNTKICRASCCYNVPLPIGFLDSHRDAIVTKPACCAVSPGTTYEVPMTNADWQRNKCPFLRDDYRCNVYQERPEVCRRMAEVPEMACPFNKLTKRVMENLNLKPYYIEGRGIYVPIINKVLAVENSCEGRRVPFEVAASKSVPTVREWLIILFFKGEINIILRELGKEPLRSGWYWSSSTDRNESGSAWNVNLEDGTVRCDRCAYEDFAREVYSL